MKIGILAAMIFGTLTISSCANGQGSNSKIADKISQLNEFRVEEKRIDSLRQTGIRVDLTISIVEVSFDDEDKGRNVFTAFINEDLGYAETILYEVKFNSDTQEIISIKRNKRKF